MKRILIVALLLSAACGAQDAGTIPFPDIVGAVAQGQNAANEAYGQAAKTALIKQQTALLKQQTQALKQENALMAQQQKTALLASQIPNQFIWAVRKPRIDDIDAATGKARFATFADYEDAKDEWLIEEAMRRFEALHATTQAKP